MGRRRFIQTACGFTAAGLLAGCLSNQEGNANPQSIDQWLADTGNYDGIVDLTGKDTVTVKVGAQGNNGANAFAPAAIRISKGATVIWEWVSGYHNVVATGGAFSSGEPEKSATFRYTFESTGTWYYYCEPHRSIGMKGAVVVADDNSEDSQ